RPRTDALAGRRRRQRRAFQALVAVTALFFAPVTWAYVASDGYRATLDDVPARPVALVLGARVWGSSPSLFLARRLDLAAELYRRGKVRAVLVSGDNSRPDYNETDAMRAYLINRGIPERKVVGDYAGFDTWDSCVRARKVFGAARLIVVTQRFHLARAVALCRAAGLDAYGVGDDSAQYRLITTYYGATREVFASFKALADAVFRPDPHHLGRRETGLDEALASSLSPCPDTDRSIE
ncbi:membrane protein, partial [Carbonactinospora thermoautotrophica]